MIERGADGLGGRLIGLGGFVGVRGLPAGEVGLFPPRRPGVGQEGLDLLAERLQFLDRTGGRELGLELAMRQRRRLGLGDIATPGLPGQLEEIGPGVDRATFGLDP